MSNITKAAVHARNHLDERFDLDFGVYNRRPIAGTTTWSQHSWGNALDIVQAGRGYGDSTPAHQLYLDEVFAFLYEHKFELSIRTLLWRKKGHWDHCHADFWAKGSGVPPRSDPTVGGKFAFSWGEIVTGDPGPENGYWTPDKNTGVMLMDLADYIATLIPADITKLVERYLPTHDDQYWIAKLDNPTDPEWTRFYVSIDVESKAQLPTG